jgi:CRISPR-associated endonuclease/helicase Cas3
MLSKKFVEEKEILNKENLSKIAYLIGISHDFGKANPLFQKKIKENLHTSNADHALISGIWTYYVVKNYINKYGIQVDDLNLPLISYLVVARHHSDLRDIHGEEGEIQSLKDGLDRMVEQIEQIRQNKEELIEIYRDLCEEIEIICDLDQFIKEFKNTFQKLIKEFYTIDKGDIYYYMTTIFLYSVLLDADKVKASNTSLPYRIPIDPNLVDEYIKNKFPNPTKEIDKKRREIYHKIEEFICNFNPAKEKMISIELPTGSGKTLLSFSLALKMRDKIYKELNILPRIIYTLPYLSIVDQNANVLGEVLRNQHLRNVDYEKINNVNSNQILPKSEVNSDLLLIHHHLADMFFKTDEMEFDISKSRILTEGWNSEIIVTTFVQLFHSLITNRNNSVRKFHKIVNSIIILDEVQNIPFKYWKLVSDILKTLVEKYNTWVILMTATMPMILNRDELSRLFDNSDEYYSFFNRVCYEYNNELETIDDLFNHIVSNIDRINGDLLVILNRITAVKDLYIRMKDHFGGKVDENGILINEDKKIKIINLSTNIVPYHRLKRISEIKKKDNFKKIIISTQLIEAGVDISTRTVYRDIAPIDSIIQSGGRCNRGNEYGNLGGKVIILELKENGSPHWKHVYDPVLIEHARQALKDKLKFEEKEIREIVQSYFKELTLKKAEDKIILESIEKFNFSKLSEFKLIDEDYPKYDVFIELDENASKILDRFRKLAEIEDPISRKNEFLKIKGTFYNYVISVPEKVVVSLMPTKIMGIYVIEKDNLKSDYNCETGINLNTNSLIL